MNYIEEHRDLFSLSISEYSFVHCISSDFKLGAGIAHEFDGRFSIRQHLFKRYPNYHDRWVSEGIKYDCLITDLNNWGYVYRTRSIETNVNPIFNLVTKTNYWDKPTLESMRGSLTLLKEYCVSLNIKKLAMPCIGCGLDRLTWSKVSKLIKQIFDDTDIEIRVCIQ